MLLSWSAKNPIVRDGLDVLRKYGTDAHAYIPGIGTINGLTAGNYLDSAGTTAATVDGLIGRMNDAGGGSITATQGTTANKPILRNVAGLSYAEFDGVNDYLNFSAVPFQMADDHCFGACLNPTSSATNKVWFGYRWVGAGTARLHAYFTSTAGLLRIAYTDDAAATAAIQGVVNYHGTNLVASVRKSSGTLSVNVNTASIGTTSIAGLGAATFDGAFLGCSGTAATPSSFMMGADYGHYVIKGTVSDADRLTMDRFIGLGVVSF